MKRFLSLTMILVFLSGCVGQPTIESLPDASNIEIPSGSSSVTSTATATPTATPTAIPYAPQERASNTLANTLSVQPAQEISLNEQGELIGLSAALPTERVAEIKEQYQTLAELYSLMDVYYAADTATNRFVLLVVFGDTLLHRIEIGADGQKLLYDFPLSFEKKGEKLELSGEYATIAFPGNQHLGVLWENGYPAILSNRMVAQTGAGVFTYRLNYLEAYSYTAQMWEQVTGTELLMEKLPSVEMDLIPRHTQSVVYQYMGVNISTDFITDASVAPDDIIWTIWDATYAQFIAKMFFSIWWSRVHPVGAATQDDFREYMTLWAQAQASGLEADWEKIQIPDIWANDLSDGNGYSQKPYTMWLMHAGETSAGVRGIEKVSIVMLGGDKADYITNFGLKENVWGYGWGVNINKSELLLYYHFEDYFIWGRTSTWTNILASELSNFNRYMLLNRGESVDICGKVVPNTILYRMLKSGISLIQ